MDKWYDDNGYLIIMAWDTDIPAATYADNVIRFPVERVRR
jgi:hypothetical protein